MGRFIPCVLRPELRAAFRVLVLLVSGFSPCLTSCLEGTRPKGVEGTRFPDLHRVGMGNPGHKMALLAASVPRRASWDKKAGVWEQGGCLLWDAGEEFQIRHLMCEGKLVPGVWWVECGPRRYETPGTTGTAVSRGSCEQRCFMQLRSILQLTPTRTSRTEQRSFSGCQRRSRSRRIHQPRSALPARRICLRRAVSSPGSSSAHP